MFVWGGVIRRPKRRAGVEFAGDGQRRLKGRRQVAVDVVKQVAVVDLLAAARYLGQLVVGEQVLVESGTGVGGRAGLAHDDETGRFDVDDVLLELGSPQGLQRLLIKDASVAQLYDLLDAPVGRPVQVALVVAKLHKEAVVDVHLLTV